MLAYSNGRSLWQANASLIANNLLAGNEGGSVGQRSSAVQGIVAVRHPVNPSKIYIFTSDDALTNANVGVNININDLTRDYNAIVLAGGSTIPRDLPIPGRELNGVHHAMHFLKQQNKLVAGSDPLAKKNIESNVLDHLLSAKDKHVVVIGGGDTGSDCVGTSNRQGAASITQFELMPKPPESRSTIMPWPTYPMVMKTTSSHEEGCERQWAVATKEFITTITAQRNGDLFTRESKH